MENFSLALLALAYLAAFVIFQKLASKLHLSKRKSPPGPKPWPIIGNLNVLGNLPHQSLHRLSEKYGDIMQLRYGSSPVVVASSPEMAKQFLRTHDKVFASRPLLAAGKIVSYNYSDMSRAPYGPHWRQARKILREQVFTADKLKFYEHIHHEERRKLFSNLHACSGEPVVLRQHVKRYTMSTISRIVYGDWCPKSDEINAVKKIDKLLEMVDEWFVLYGLVDIGDWIPSLSVMDLQGYKKRAMAFAKNFDKFHNSIVGDHVAAGAVKKDMVPENVLDALLQIAEDPIANLEVEVTTDVVKALSLDLLAAGSDTSGLSVEWALLEIMKNPRIMDKAKEELDRVIGKNRWVEENDYPQLPYMDAIILETMRLHPITTLLPSHYAMEDTNVSGYNISKGTMVVVNLWSIGRDPKLWDSPEEFLPERFLGRKTDISGGDFRLLPFGSGRRRCPGYNLGIQTVRITLANLLHGFNFKLVEGMNHEDVCAEEEYALTTHPKMPLTIVLEPALDMEYYKIY